MSIAISTLTDIRSHIKYATAVARQRIDRLTRTGVPDDLNWRERGRILLLNRTLIIIIPLMLMHVMYQLLTGFLLGTLIPMLLILYWGIIAMVSFRGLHRLAKWLFVGPMFPAIGVLMVVTGESGGMEMSFLVGGVFSLILFQSWIERLLLLLLALFLSFFAAEWYLMTHGGIWPGASGDGLFGLIFLFNFLGMLAVILYYHDLFLRHVHEMEQLFADLQRKNDRLERANRELERFAYTASHHFKSPLKNISNLLGLLERRMEASVSDTVGRYVDLVKSDSRHLYRLTEDLMVYAKVGGQPTIRAAEPSCDLKEVLRRVRSNLQPILSGSGGQLVVDLGAVRILRMRQFDAELLLQNLIHNGLKYNQATNPTVAVRATSEAGNTRLSITDNGIGIPEEFHADIFDIYTRLHPRDQYYGTGIGLSICRKLVSMYHGEICLRSTPGRGSEFTLIIPEKEAAELAATPPPKVVSPLEEFT